MNFTVFLASPKTGSEKALKKTIDAFYKSGKLFIENIDISEIPNAPEGSVYRVSINFNSSSRIGDEEEKSKIIQALLDRLCVLAFTNGFTPFDQYGNEIYALPSYGFDIIFYSEQTANEPALRDIIVSLGKEMPGHEGKFNIRTHKPEDEAGEYYMASIVIDDYATPEERERIKYAFYFRLVMLAKEKGFEAVTLDK